MSYYPTERHGGCMESISRCCRDAYVYPLDTRKLLYVGGGILGVVLVAIVWSGFSSSSSSAAQTVSGSSVLQEAPLIVGSNFFTTNLRNLVHNNLTKVDFNQSLKNDSLFGSENCKSCQTDLPRLQSGLVASQIWSINVPCDAMYKDAVSITLESVDAITRLIANYPSSLAMYTSSSDVTADFSSNQIGSILGITSGHSIDGRLPVLRTLKTLGVRVMALTSNCSNAWATSYTTTNDTGLSSFGQSLVKEMNRIGMLIDLSEASYQTQVDVLNITKAPVIFSHAAAYSLVNNSRNIQDDILDKLKTNNGVLMVTFAQNYISSNSSNATITNIIEHINYIKDRIGVTGVGIGAEYDASNETYPSSLSDVSTFPTLFDQLGETWTSTDDLKKLAGGNLLRVLEAVEEYAKEAESLPVDETYKLQSNATCYSDYDSRNGDDSTTATTTSPSTNVTVTTETPVSNTTVATNTTTATNTTVSTITTTLNNTATPTNSTLS